MPPTEQMLGRTVLLWWLPRTAYMSTYLYFLLVHPQKLAAEGNPLYFWSLLAFFFLTMLTRLQYFKEPTIYKIICSSSSKQKGYEILKNDSLLRGFIWSLCHLVTFNVGPRHDDVWVANSSEYLQIPWTLLRGNALAVNWYAPYLVVKEPWLITLE